MKGLKYFLFDLYFVVSLSSFAYLYELGHIPEWLTICLVGLAFFNIDYTYMENNLGKENAINKKFKNCTWGDERKWL